jgi:tetratricopeptide (TPR) repeat protein
MQEQALSLLEQQVFPEKSEGEPAITDPADLEKFVDGILADPDADSHPLLEKLYLFKAQLALMLNQPDEAKTAASQLLEKYPPGPNSDQYITDAHMVLAQVYWHNGQPGGQPRLAINELLQAHDGLPADQRAPVELSLAYLYFMNGDYHNAAASYTDLLNHPDPGFLITRGELLLLAVESDLRAGSIDDARTIVDDPALLDVPQDDRWRAEYELLIAMRDNNRAPEAFQRLNRKLDPEHKNLLQPELYLRLLWLKAYLAVGQSEPEAGKFVEDLQEEIESLTPDVIAGLGLLPTDRQTLTDLLPGLRAEALLLQGRAEGQAQQYDAQGKTFALLRQNYPGTDPALNSYLVEAGLLDTQSKFTEAQRLYNTVTDSFPKSDQAPLALYCSALDSAQLGKTQDALSLLLKFVETYKDNPAQKLRLYDVRMRQSFLEGKIDTQASWENARDIYGVLIKDYADYPSLVAAAKVGHAETLFQLARMPDADPQRRQDAIDELKVLYNQTNLPVDARVKVGYMRGNLLEYGSKPDPDDAKDAYYAVEHDILNDPTLTAELDNTPDGRYWMSRCLAALETILKQQNNDAEVEQIDRIIAAHGLGPATPSPSPAPVPTATN